MSNETEDFVVDDINLADPEIKGWDGSMGPQLPAGEYLVTVVEAKVESNKAQDGRNLVLTLQVDTEGDYYGQTVKNWLPLQGKDGKTAYLKRLAHVIRDVLGVPLLPSGGFQTSATIGRQMYINVTIEQQKEFDPTRSQEVVRERMRIQGERPAQQAAPVAPSAPPARPPAQAAKPAGKPVGKPIAAR